VSGSSEGFGELIGGVGFRGNILKFDRSSELLIMKMVVLNIDVL
jgi:hypothetical protein